MLLGPPRQYLFAFLSSCAGIQTRYHFLKKFKALPFQNSFKGKWEHWKKQCDVD